MGDLLHPPQITDRSVAILGTAPTHVATTGLPVISHGPVATAGGYDTVLVTSGVGAHDVVRATTSLERVKLHTGFQPIGSMCSRAPILAPPGLLEVRQTATDETSVDALRAHGVELIEAPFVHQGNVATAAGCLAALDVCGWIVGELLGTEERREMLPAAQRVGDVVARPS